MEFNENEIYEKNNLSIYKSIFYENQIEDEYPSFDKNNNKNYKKPSVIDQGYNYPNISQSVYKFYEKDGKKLIEDEKSPIYKGKE